MEKKLPKVFANTISKELNNNERVYYEKNEDVKKEVKPKKKNNELNINQKINKIFGSSKYVYKADVRITFNDGNIENKKIIGRNKNELITMENELIDISKITDIEFSED